MHIRGEPLFYLGGTTSGGGVEKMARKLLVMVALMSLVLLAQAASGLAEVINLPGQGGGMNWTEYNYVHLGDAGNSFRAGYPDMDNYGYTGTNNWGIAESINTSAAAPTQTAEGTAYTATYDNLVNAIHIGQFGDEYDQYSTTQIRFIYYPETQPQRNISIISTDFVLTTTTVYDSDNNFVKETIFGSGTNYLDNDTYFSLTGTLVVVKYFDIGTYGLEGNNGYITDLQLTYGAAEPSAVPLPGAVWLLGTGLFGLACVGRRRKS
jgi:hypothetical protein